MAERGGRWVEGDAGGWCLTSAWLSCSCSGVVECHVVLGRYWSPEIRYLVLRC